MSLTRKRLAGLACLAGVICAAGCVAYLRYWRVPELNASLKPVGPPTASDLALGQDPPEAPCEPGLGLTQPIETTLCQLVQHPDDFSCKRVRFRANFETDCMENSILLDDLCERGIAPYGSPDPAADAFFEGACASGQFDATVKRTATFTGTFRIQKRNGRSICALEIERVANVKISSATRPEYHFAG